MTLATATSTSPAMADAAALVRLQAWLSPSFPIGAFSYSHGIEYAVEAGLVRDAASLREWLAVALEQGAGRTDALLLAAAYHAIEEAAHSGDWYDLLDVASLAQACRGTSELALESTAQGAAFIEMALAAWPHPVMVGAYAAFPPDLIPALPVAIAVTAAAHGVPLAAALPCALHAMVASMVSAGVRLIPLGQTDGQRTVAALEPEVLRLAETVLSSFSMRGPDAAARQQAGTPRRAAELLRELLGGAALGIDWCSMQHETQYTRLYRS